ncbi:MAG: hypothetical protein LBO73_03345 [Holosporaceae bacterium]|jgi:dihydrofolate synthase/folylpolyglutamate synthase|nr:hypothetical protein [Holosporaceae bacterium]
MEDILVFLKGQTQSHGIEPIKQALRLLKADTSPGTRTAVIAGTNGKGSTGATLQTLLAETGKNVGFFSSPHLMKINERIKLNGNDISDEEFCEIFHLVHEKVRRFDFSCFEYLTLMAAVCFFRIRRVDFAVFEIGLGGTLDSVNAVSHEVSIITRLGMDHEAILGDSAKEIAANKLGIVSEGNRVFHLEFQDEEIRRLSREIAQKFRAEFTEVRPYDYVVDATGKYPVFLLKTPFGDFPLNLQGKRAAENTSLALAVFSHLVGDIRPFLPALKRVNWPGRMEKIVFGNRDVFLSGDHNPQGIDSLLEILRHYKFEKVHFVIGICSDKKHSEMLEKLTGFPNSLLYLTETPERTLPVQDYDERFRRAATFVSPNPTEALNAALANASEHDLTVVTGSLYLAGKIKAAVGAPSPG